MTDDRGSALLVVLIDIEPEWEDEFNRWYEHEHLPERVGLPGFLSARRFVASLGGPKYLAIYELEDESALASEVYTQLMALPSEWNVQVSAHFTTRIRAVYRDITPAAITTAFTAARHTTSANTTSNIGEQK